MQLLNITHVIDSLEIGGAEIMLSSLAQTQRRQGHRVRVICLFREGPLVKHLREAGIDVYVCRHKPVDRSLRSKLRTILELRAQFRRAQTDIVHCHNVTATFLGAPAGWLARAGGIFTTRHGFLADDEAPKRERLFWAAARFCDRIVTVSESTRTSISTLEFAQASKIITIRNGVEPRVVKTPCPAASRSGFRVIIVARLKPPKDHETLLRATALLRGQIPDLSVMIVGSGPMESRLKELAASLDLNQVVEFLGDRDDVGDLLSRADVFALVSKGEGLPLSMLEAMAAGLPLILSEVGGIPEVARDLRGARLVAPGDIAGLAAAILDYSRRRQELPRLGEQNREYFEQHYSAEGMWKAYADLYFECPAFAGVN